jgi:hypothetical protein
MARSKKSGFGNIRRMTSGRYQVRWTDPVTKRQHTGERTFGTMAEADRYRKKIDHEISQGLWQDPALKTRMTLADFVDTWLDDKNLKNEKVWNDYRYTFDTYVLPYLGSRYLSEMEQQQQLIRQWEKDLQAYFDDRPNDGSATMAKAWRYLKSAFSDAINDYEMMKDNPCRKRITKNVTPKEKIPLTTGEIYAVAGALPDQYPAFFLLLIATGIRKGEASALTRSDLDLDSDRPSLNVTKQIQKMGAGRYEIGEPKSAAGKRPVPIPSDLVPILREHLDTFTDPNPDALVFTNRNGNPLCDSAYQVIKRAGIKIGRPDITVHLERHTAVSLALNAGATDAELLSRFGHSSVEVSRNYRWTNDEHKEAVTERINQDLFGTSNVVQLRPIRTA